MRQLASLDAAAGVIRQITTVSVAALELEAYRSAGTMPHVRSTASRSMRAVRAIAKGHARPRPDGCAHVAVPSSLVGRVKIMAKSLKLRAEHDITSGPPHYDARLATLSGGKPVS